MNIPERLEYSGENACKLARPERFELPTFWFVGRAAIFRHFEINNLDRPPSPNFPPRVAKSRSARFQLYAELRL